MSKILDLIDTRFRLLQEAAEDLSWKEMPELLQYSKANGGEGTPSPGYHALRAIAGPCTDHPTWAMDWTSPSGYEYKKGTAAPKWTEQEIHVAMMPQIRTWARGQSRKAYGGGHAARTNKSAIDDAAMNMHTALQRALQQEKDEGRTLSGGGFVSWVTALIQPYGQTGVGGTNAERKALGRTGELLKTKDPAKALAIANAVGPQYREHKSNKLDPDNPYGQFSPDLYKLGTTLAKALEANDPEQIETIRKEISLLDDGKGDWSSGKIKDAMGLVQGTDTGRRDIATPHGAGEGSDAKAHLDRLMHTGIKSMDTPVGDEGGTLGSLIGDQGSSGFRTVRPEGPNMTGMDTEVIFKALELGRKFEFMSRKNPKIKAECESQGLTPIGDGDFRYLIRLMSTWLPDGNYPDKGVPGKDPELGKDGKPSKWVQNGQPHMMEKTEIVNDIMSSTNTGNESGVTLDMIAKMGSPMLTPVEAEFVAYICGVNPKAPGKPLKQKDIADISGTSKGNVGTRIGKAAMKLGMTMDKFTAKIQGMASSGSKETASPISANPVDVFHKWVKEYESSVDDDLDESIIKCNWIERKIIHDCYNAVARLNYWLNIKPIIEGRNLPVIYSRRMLGRV